MNPGEPVEAELDQLAEEFVARTRKGESPTISSYARANPTLADEITDLFPLLLDLEGGRDPDAPPGHELGDYLLLREIGRGGMGVVYEAVQKTLGRRVALKILPKQMTLDRRFLDRFRLEAQAAARLQHPHIVPVIGFGEDKGSYYFTMQYVDGCGLDQVLPHVRRLFGQPATLEADSDSGSALAHRMLSAAWHGDRDDASAVKQGERLAVGRTYYDNVARLLLQAAEGIAAAHAQGVLHRDVKPSNLMLDDKGSVWITDFGLCKETESGGLTQPGDLLGTFRYMAPERFEGVSDVQGDVFGLGITLYELLTREPAYRGDDRAAIAAQIVNTAPVRPRKLDPKLPRDLELIVLKAIARDRSQRYATANALADDLRAYLARRPISARPPTFGYLLRSSVRRHKAIALISAAAIVALVASSAYYVTNLRDKERTARFGQYVANIAAAETALRDRDVPVAQRLLDEAPEEFRNWEWHHLRSRLDRSWRSFPRWQWPVRLVAHSPDGTYLATVAAGAVRIHDETSTELITTVQHRTHIRAFAWHPEGNAWAAGTREGLEVWSFPEGERLVDLQIGNVQGVAFSQDGSRLAFGGHDGILRVADTATRKETFAQSLHGQIHAVALDPTGRWLAAGSWDGTVSVFDLTTGSLQWRERCGRTSVRSLAFVGDRLATPSSDGHVELRRIDDGSLVHVLGHKRAPGGVTPSSDGRRLLTWDGSLVHVWDAAQGEAVLTYGNDSSSTCASFHPDGTKLVAGSQRGSVSEWLLPPGGDPDRGAGDFRAIESMDFSPSGEFFVTGGTILRFFDAATHEEVRNWIGHRVPVKRVRYSPDGAWVASADIAGEVLLWDVATDSLVRRIQAVEGNPLGAGPTVTGVAFSADSQRLFTCGHDGMVNVWRVQTGQRILQRQLVDDRILTSLAASHNGRWIAVGGYFGNVHVLKSDDLSSVHVCEGQTSVITGVTFQRDDRTLASACFDRTVVLWDVASGKPRRTLRALTSDSSGVADAFLSVSFLPDGSRVAASSADGSAKLWDTASGRLVATLRGDNNWMWNARFSPDAQRLVTVEGRGLVRLWETRPLRDRLEHAGSSTLATDADEFFERVRSQHTDPDAVLAAIRASTDVEPDVREAALRRAYRARVTPTALMDRLWRTFVPAAFDAGERLTIFGIARDLKDAGEHDGVQIGVRETLYALGAYRCDRLGIGRVRTRLAMMVNAKGDPGLHAVDLAVLSMALARLEQIDEARAWMTKLDEHLAAHPKARQARGVAALHAEARALLGE